MNGYEDLKVTSRISAGEAVAIVGVGAVLPDALEAGQFWSNVLGRKDSIGEVPAGRWNVKDFYDPDPAAPEKTYCKIGAFVKDFTFNALAYKIPPKVAETMDMVQRWAIEATRQALDDAGCLTREFDRERTAVIFGNALQEEAMNRSNLRIHLPLYANSLMEDPEFMALPEATRSSLLEGMARRIREMTVPVTEDTMPGELSNVIAGRVANVFNLRGANFTTDAACASSLAAVNVACAGLLRGEYDMVVTGGVDRSMSASTYIKFSKIGALSAEGSFPFDERAGGFVMGEGCACFVMKRYSDALAQGDRVYAVITGIGTSSDGKGKGITAPNLEGQLLALRRAYESAGLDPATVDMIEAHGTATRVGDVVEAQALARIMEGRDVKRPARLTSVKSQIGHLKAGAGAAALLKTALALHHGMYPPSINCENPNPNIDWNAVPLRVQRESEPWERVGGRPRTAGISSFGFGGTNFHIVLQEAEDVESLTTRSGNRRVRAGIETAGKEETMQDHDIARDMLDRVRFMTAHSLQSLGAALLEGKKPQRLGSLEEAACLAEKPWRLAVAGTDEAALEERVKKLVEAAQKGLDEKKIAFLRRQGVYISDQTFRSVGFLYPGQGSQSINMLAVLRERYAAFREVLERADRVMEPLVGSRLSTLIYTDLPEEAPERASMEEMLRQTQITQPAMLTMDLAMTRVLEGMGIFPDAVTGHSLGEYGALVSAGVIAFEDSLEIVAARGREMASVSIDDPGMMFAAMADDETVEKLIARIDGYLLPANKNSRKQTVVAGSTEAVKKAMEVFEAEGVRTVPLKVSHAFHSKIVAGAIEPLRRVLSRYAFSKPRVPVFGNVTGKAYPMDASKEHFIDMLGRQIASSVEFIKCLENMYGAGARFFVEVGPRKVLASFAEDVLPRAEILVSCANNHRQGDLESLANLFAAAAVAGAIRPAGVAHAGTGSRDGGSVHGGTGEGGSAFRAGAGEGGERPRALTSGDLLSEILELVSEKTGYPVDMLDPAMDMEADLGIDTVKQAELFSLIRKRYAIPKQENLKLKDYPTINHVAGFVAGLVGSTEPEAQPPAGMEAAPAAGRQEGAARTGGTGNLLAEILELVSEKTGYPVDMLDPAMDMEADLGIDTVKQAELFSLIRKRYAIPKQENLKLKDYPTINHVAGFVAGFVGSDGGDAPAEQPEPPAPETVAPEAVQPADPEPVRTVRPAGAKPRRAAGSTIVVTGSAVGLPGRARRLFGDGNFDDIFSGMNFIENLPGPVQRKLVDLNMVKIDKGNGDEFIQKRVEDTGDVIKLAGQMGILDVTADYGMDRDLAETMDDTARLAAAAGYEALRDAGIPLVLETRRTTTGAHIPVGWYLPAGLQDETGVIFASAFPGLNRFAQELERYYRHVLLGEPYEFDRKILFGILAMGHTQFAQLIHARGPNLQVNAACASTLIAMATAADWIAAGRCRRVIVISSDNPTSETLMPWVGGGFLSNGGAATDENVEDAAIPFDRRRHGLIVGMGAAALVLEAEEEVRARGMTALARIVNTRILNSAFHGTRLDPGHIAGQLSDFVRESADMQGCTVEDLARDLVFLSHETYTPARGGSASAEVRALREAFGPHLAQVIVTNTKGFTGHPMGVGIEEAVAPRILHEQRVPPVANVDRIDTEFDDLNLSRGSQAPVQRVLRFSAGFGSQVGMALLERDEVTGRRRLDEALHRAWLEAATGGNSAGLFVEGRVLKMRAQGPGRDVGRAKDRTESGAKPAPAMPVEEVRRRVVALIAERTGYPEDMLDPDMDMEADLGIDTVKQAELFSVVRKTFNIPKVENLRLKDYPTITHVVKFITERLATGAAPAPAAVPPPEEEDAYEEKPVDETLYEAVESFTARMRRPVQHWLPPASHFPETGVILSRGDVVVLHGRGSFRQELEKELGRLGVAAVDARDGSALEESGPVRGIVFFEDETFLKMPALEDLAFHGELVVNEAVDRVDTLQRVAKTGRFDEDKGFILGVTVNAAAQAAGRSDAVDLAGGCLTGFIKSLAFEFPGCVVKAVDVDSGTPPSATALLLVKEIVHDREAREVGIFRGTRWSLDLEDVEIPAPETVSGPSDRPVVLVTGAGGAVTSDAVRKIAFMGPADFVLMDVIKPEMTRGGKWSRRFGRIMSLIEFVEAKGGSAMYVTADVCDSLSVSRAVKSAMVRYGRIDVVVHGAGVERSRSVVKKPLDEFRMIAAIKIQGAANLVSAVLGRCRPRMFLFFSSVAGRFGNAGQADYAAGNDFMARLAAAMGSQVPDVIMTAVDWTAWDGEGMAGNGAIQAVLEEAGVELLPRREGLDIFWRILSGPPVGPEVVVSRSLGDMERFYNPSLGREQDLPGGSAETGLKVTLSPAAEVYLWDHSVEGTPLLPAVKGLEHFELASGPVVGEGWKLVGVRDAVFHRAVKFFSGRPRDIFLRTSIGYEGDFITSRCFLESLQPGPSGGERVLNFEASLMYDYDQEEGKRNGDILMTRSDGIDLAGAGWDESAAIGSSEVYRYLFHKNQFQVVDSFCLAANRNDCGLGRMKVAPRANLSGMYMLVEFGMQSAGLYLLRTAGMAALPAAIQSVSLLERLDDRKPYRAVAIYRGTRSGPDEMTRYIFDVSIRDPEGNPVMWIDGLELIQTERVAEAQAAARELPSLEAGGQAAVRM